jgi:ribulose-5-phosphate 4-epimerase/fuculose-1-phosphate aldolase
VTISKVVVVREWDSEVFHRRVLELESQGYVARRESYRITPEMNPETGEVIHLHTIELFRPETDQK